MDERVRMIYLTSYFKHWKYKIVNGVFMILPHYRDRSCWRPGLEGWWLKKYIMRRE